MAELPTGMGFVGTGLILGYRSQRVGSRIG